MPRAVLLCLVLEKGLTKEEKIKKLEEELKERKDRANKKFKTTASMYGTGSTLEAFPNHAIHKRKTEEIAPVPRRPKKS